MRRSIRLRRRLQTSRTAAVETLFAPVPFVVLAARPEPHLSDQCLKLLKTVEGLPLVFAEIGALSDLGPHPVVIPHESDRRLILDERGRAFTDVPTNEVMLNAQARLQTDVDLLASAVEEEPLCHLQPGLLGILPARHAWADLGCEIIESEAVRLVYAIRVRTSNVEKYKVWHLLKDLALIIFDSMRREDDVSYSEQAEEQERIFDVVGYPTKTRRITGQCRDPRVPPLEQPVSKASAKREELISRLRPKVIKNALLQMSQSEVAEAQCVSV
jgi:hypothetical protein